MRSIRFRLPSPSMAVALLALFVALGGSAYAALKVGSKQIVNNSVRSADLRNNDVRSKDVRNDGLTGADVNESTLGAVPSAATAGNADTLGGIGPSGFVRTPTEPVRLVDSPGNPAFENGWANSVLGASAGFFKDQFGVVHLQGDLNPPNSSSTVFTLPEGYRPDQTGASGPQFLVIGDNTFGVVQIKDNGQVDLLDSFDNRVALNGITFRATH